MDRCRASRTISNATTRSVFSKRTFATEETIAATVPTKIIDWLVERRRSGWFAALVQVAQNKFRNYVFNVLFRADVCRANGYVPTRQTVAST